MRATRVIARTYGNGAVSLRVFDWTDEVVYLVDEHDLNVTSTEEQAVVPIGFPREDVYVYSEALLTQAERQASNWWKSSKAVRWRPNESG